MKYAFIQSVRRTTKLPLKRLIDLVAVSSSGYYAWLKRKPSRRFQEADQLDHEIAKVYWQHRGLYGYRRIYVEWLESGLYSGSRDRIRRRMRQMDLQAITKKKFKQTTDSTHDKAIALNLLNQDFAMNKPDKAWVGDITYVRVDMSPINYENLVLKSAG